MVQSPAHSLELWHRRKHGTAADSRPYAQRTPGGVLLEHYVDLSVEMDDLRRVVEEPGEDEESLDDRAMARAQKRLSELRGVLTESEEEEDSWLDEGEDGVEEVDLSEFKDTVFRPENFF